MEDVLPKKRNREVASQPIDCYADGIHYFHMSIVVKFSWFIDDGQLHQQLMSALVVPSQVVFGGLSQRLNFRRFNLRWLTETPTDRALIPKLFGRAGLCSWLEGFFLWTKAVSESFVHHRRVGWPLLNLEPVLVSRV